MTWLARQRELSSRVSARPLQVAAVLVLAAAAGLTAAIGVPAIASEPLRAGACLALVLPPAVSAWLLVRRRTGFVPLLVSVGSMLLFLPRLVHVDQSTGLLAAAQLTPEEFERALANTELLLIVFSVFLGLSVAVAARHPRLIAHRKRVTDGADPAALLTQSVRVRGALVVGAVTGVGALITGVTQGVGARDFENVGQSGPLALLSTGPAAGALWLAGQRRAGLAVLGLSLLGPFLIGGRQAVLTPLLYFMAALLVRRRAETGGSLRLSPKVVLAWAILAMIVLSAVVIATTARRSAVDTALNQGTKPSLYATMVERQTLLDPLIVAVAREDRPQGMRIYRRALALPIPRFLWRDKPLSYDFHFRERQFPAYGGGIPITLAGTAYLSFLLPGVALAGLLLGLAAVAAEHLLNSRTARGVLVGVAACLFLLDVLRIGGLYREFLTSGLDLALIMVLTRHVRRPAPGFAENYPSPPEGTFPSPPGSPGVPIGSR